MNLSPRKFLPWVTTAVVAMLLPVVSLAAQDRPALPAPIGSPELLSVGGGLFVVILAIIVLGVLYARTQGLRGSKSGVINIVATQAIGPKERIAVVEVADKQLLIGMTTTSVQTLHVFDEPVLTAPEPKVTFAERLKLTMRGDSK